PPVSSRGCCVIRPREIRSRVRSSPRASLGGVACHYFQATSPFFSPRPQLEPAMGLVLTAAPAVEPLTVDEVKAHLRIDHTDEDMLLASLIASSRLHIEAALDLALISQSWSWALDAWPDPRALELPLRPVQSVEAIRVAAEDGTMVQLSPDRFLVDGASIPSRVLSTSESWPRPGIPALGIEVAFTAGFGDEPSAV